MSEQTATKPTIAKPTPTREEIELHRQKRLVKMGEWLDNNRTLLFVIQSVVCNAMCEWCEDLSSTADQTAICKMEESLDLFVETIAKLRNTNFCPDHKD